MALKFLSALTMNFLCDEEEIKHFWVFVISFHTGIDLVYLIGF